MSSQATSPPQALLLDAGNTVVFLDHDVVAETLTELGHRVDVAALARTQRTANQSYAHALRNGAAHEDGWQRFMASWLAAAGVETTALASAVSQLRAVHDEFNLWRKVPPGLTDALTRLRETGVLLGIVSNSEGQIDRLFARVGLDHSFDIIVDSALEGVRKPDPEIFYRACRRLDVEPRACLYAGDIPDVDVIGARRAGLMAVLIDPFDVYPDYRDAPRYSSVVDLVAALLDQRLAWPGLHPSRDES
jgi:HAD superfamily hydrolase (TIGR01549 family)